MGQETKPWRRRFYDGLMHPVPMENPVCDQVRKVCTEILAPLVEADGGTLEIVELRPDQVSIHLAGTCAGCPGATLTTRLVIEPAILAIAPSMRVHVSAGFDPVDRAHRAMVPAA